MSGIPRDIEFPFCPCKGIVVILIKSQYWPGSPVNPSIAFSFELLDMLEALLLECQVAVQDFTQAMSYLIKSKIFQVRMYTLILLHLATVHRCCGYPCMKEYHSFMIL